MWPAMRAMTEWNPWAEARVKSSARRARPMPRAPLRPVDVDGVLGGGGVARSLPEGREGPEPEHDLVVGAQMPVLRRRRLDRHDGRVDTPVFEEPGLLLLPGARHHVERVGAPEHLDVVDGPDRFGVAEGGQSDMHGRMVLLALHQQWRRRRRVSCSGYH